MTEAVRPARSPELVGLQYLRGLAAVLVVLLHLGGQITRHQSDFAVVRSLGVGVDIFFVISGFVMAYSTDEGRSIGAGRFLSRRAIRIVPLYWTMTALMLAAVWFVPAVTQSARLDWSHVLRSFLFVPAAHPHPFNHGLFFPLVVPGWTINLEMFFYLVFAAGLAVSGGRRLIPIVVASVVLAAIVAFGQDGPSMAPGSLPGFYANPMVLQFVSGMWLAVAFRRLPRPPQWVVLAAGLAALALLFLWNGGGTGWFGSSIWPRTIGASILVYAGACMTGPALRFPSLLGDTSYSLYLSQTFTVSAAAQIGDALGLFDSRPGQVAFLILGLAVAILGGYLCWLLVERPMTTATRRLFEGGRKPRPFVGAEGTV